LQLAKRIKEGPIAVALQDESVNRNIGVIDDWSRQGVTVDTDIQLGNLVINSEIRKHIDGVQDRLAGREVDVVVHLMADAIDRDTSVLQVGYQVKKKLPLRRIGGVEVVEVKLRCRLHVVSYTEGALNVISAGDVEPRTAAKTVGLRRVDDLID